jgi:hypothetical protein
LSALRARALAGEKLSDVLIIDFHVHLPGPWAGMAIPVQTGEHMLAIAERVGVLRLVVFGAIHPDLRATNDAVAAFMRRYPERVVGFATLNPYQFDMVAEARRCFDELGLKGVKLHSMHEGPHSPRPMSSYRKEWERLFAFLAERKGPVIYHGVVSEEMVRAFPEVPFVMAHGVGEVQAMERLQDCPNFHVDTASTQNPAWAIRRAVSILGPKRVLWGTDAPLDDFAQRLGVVLDSGLEEEAIRHVLGLNAARLLQIGGAS